MSGVWRPERRNKNTGTKVSGYSKSNDMRIPESWLDKHGVCSFYYERLGQSHETEVTIAGFQLRLLYESPLDGFTYGCSPADVIYLLTLAAEFCPAFPDIIVFRQPTRKQLQQTPVWGRFIYASDFGKHQGTAIVIEAQKLGGLLKISKRMTLEARSEYKRLVDDGHKFIEKKRHFQASMCEDAIRNTKLYRTFLHEMGHLADYRQKVLDDRTALNPDQEVANEFYFSRPASEREVFAHSFAENVSQRLRSIGVIPFEPLPFDKSDFVGN